MPNGQNEGTDPREPMVPPAAQGSQGAEGAPPADLAEAFARLRTPDAEAAEGAVESAGDDAEPIGKHARTEPAAGTAEAPAAEEADEQGAGEPPAASEPGEQGSPAGVGGDADGDQAIDYTPARQQIFQGIGQQAQANVAQRFRDNGIRMWDISDLYDKDESTGRVTFKNPDDEQRPFQSRKEAQDFVDAMNKQINMKFNSEVRAEQQKLLENARPALSMIEFVPVYQQMSEDERKVFDELITPYAVRDQAGNIRGFDTDLSAAADQARAIVKMFAGQQQAEPEKAKAKGEEAEGPAVDMATGSGETAADEPKDLAEAFEMLNKQKKEEKNNG